MKVCAFAGDGIGPEIMEQGLRLMDVLRRHGVPLEVEAGLLGGCAIDATGEPYPQTSQRLVEASDAVLLAAVGGPRYDSLPRHQRPEKGLLALRQHMGAFANLRPVKVFDALIDSSSLKPELIRGLDVLIVRELTGDVYFGEPRGISIKDQERVGVNTMIYSESEVRRVAHVAFSFARQRRAQVCSVDKMNVLESSQLWRETVIQVAKEYPDVMLSHLLVDNAAMQLIKRPTQFDVILTGNLFGDILSDEAAMLSGSIGLLPSASLGSDRRGLYEPIHGSAPDIQGQNKANPLGLFLSISMMMRYSFQLESWAERIEIAILQVLQDGLRTLDLAREKDTANVGTKEMGAAVIDKLKKGINV